MQTSGAPHGPEVIVTFLGGGPEHVYLRDGTVDDAAPVLPEALSGIEPESPTTTISHPDVVGWASLTATIVVDDPPGGEAEVAPTPQPVDAIERPNAKDGFFRLLESKSIPTDGVIVWEGQSPQLRDLDIANAMLEHLGLSGLIHPLTTLELTELLNVDDLKASHEVTQLIQYITRPQPPSRRMRKRAEQLRNPALEAEVARLTKIRDDMLASNPDLTEESVPLAVLAKRISLDIRRQHTAPDKAIVAGNPPMLTPKAAGYLCRHTPIVAHEVGTTLLIEFTDLAAQASNWLVHFELTPDLEKVKTFGSKITGEQARMITQFIQGISA